MNKKKTSQSWRVEDKMWLFMYQKFSPAHVSFTRPDCFPVVDDCGDFSCSGSLEVSAVRLRGVTRIAGFLPGGGNKQTKKNSLLLLLFFWEVDSSHADLPGGLCVCILFPRNIPTPETNSQTTPPLWLVAEQQESSVNFESDVLSFSFLFFFFLKLCTTVK